MVGNAERCSCALYAARASSALRSSSVFISRLPLLLICHKIERAAIDISSTVCKFGAYCRWRIAIDHKFLICHAQQLPDRLCTLCLHSASANGFFFTKAGTLHPCVFFKQLLILFAQFHAYFTPCCGFGAGNAGAAAPGTGVAEAAEPTWACCASILAFLSVSICLNWSSV